MNQVEQRKGKATSSTNSVSHSLTPSVSPLDSPLVTPPVSPLVCRPATPPLSSCLVPVLTMTRRTSVVNQRASRMIHECVPASTRTCTHFATNTKLSQ